MLTVSNALLISNYTVTVLSGGKGLLNPEVIILLNIRRAVFVEWFDLKPC